MWANGCTTSSSSEAPAAGAPNRPSFSSFAAAGVIFA